jgi:hypothetical protein
MLGNTMWVTGPGQDLDGVQRLLETEGPTHRCAVDQNGARMVR